jgi:thiol-disulfide isomerase/thioredoxin
MGFVIAAVVLVGGLCVVDLLLTFAVLRRLRVHTDELNQLRTGVTGGRPGFDREGFVGRTLAPFVARTVDGREVSRDDLVGRPRLVAFFSATCAPCHARAPELAEWARGQRLAGADPVGPALAVVTGTGSGADQLVETLGGAATVIPEPDSSRIVDALGVSAFPTFLRLDADGTIADADISMRVAAAHVAA